MVSRRDEEGDADDGDAGTDEEEEVEEAVGGASDVPKLNARGRRPWSLSFAAMVLSLMMFAG